MLVLPNCAKNFASTIDKGLPNTIPCTSHPPANCDASGSTLRPVDVRDWHQLPVESFPEPQRPFGESFAQIVSLSIDKTIFWESKTYGARICGQMQCSNPDCGKDLDQTRDKFCFNCGKAVDFRHGGSGAEEAKGGRTQEPQQQTTEVGRWEPLSENCFY